MTGRCFHCGEPMPTGEPRSVRIDGQDRPVCCPGCEAVAGLISGAGLSDFYRFRTAAAPRPDGAGGGDDPWSAFDREGVQQRFVTGNDREREAALLVEGLQCGACAWLIEKVVADLPGVLDVAVNPATAHASIRWDPARTRLSGILRRIAGLGYRPHPADRAGAGSVALREHRAALRRLAVAGLGMMQVMMYAGGLYAGAIHDDMAPDMALFLRWISALIATPVVLYAGAPFFRAAWRDLRARRPGMDVPVALAIGGAWLASLWHTLEGRGEVYFDSVTMFIFFLTVARFLEMSARHRAGRRLGALAGILPETARRLGQGGEITVLGRDELDADDRVEVRTGEVFPADGVIERGQGHVDESLLSGESAPRPRGPGERVTGGTRNLGETLVVRVEATGSAMVVAGIVRLLERAQSRRPRLARLADRVARIFVGGILGAAAVTGLVWWQFAPGRAFEVVLAVLVVTCPCALSLATPTALTAATARLARIGVLVTRTSALEKLARVDHLLVDKTGTLTQGRLTLESVDAPLGREAALRLAAALEHSARHPLARAFDAWYDTQSSTDTPITEHPGLGVSARVSDRELRIGRPDWVSQLAGACLPPPGITTDATTEVALGDAGGILARFRLTDPLRRDSRAVLAGLRRTGIRVTLISGDAAPAVAAVAERLDIDDWHARQSPEDKLARLRVLQSGGECVAMVGDGINDGPVLAGADIGIAVGDGTAVARQQADLILIGDGLAALGTALELARRTRRIIHQNLAWAACYNLAALPLAAAGLIPPWAAAIGMSASSLLVVGNSMRLGRRAAHPQPTRLAPRAVGEALS